VTSRTSRSRLGGSPGILEVVGVSLQEQRPLTGRGKRDEGLVGLDRGGESRPGLALDHALGQFQHAAEGLVGSNDHVLVVQLHDPVHGRLEDEAEALLRVAQGLVGPLETRECLVCLAEGRLLGFERVLRIARCLGAPKLVHQDPKRDGHPEHVDQP